MRSAKDILTEMGFNLSAPESTKQAFLKNLQKAAHENQKAEVIEASFGTTTNRGDSTPTGQQLSFDSEILGPKFSSRLKVGS